MMKAVRSLPAVLSLLCACILFSSCSDDDSPPPQSTTEVPAVCGTAFESSGVVARANGRAELDEPAPVNLSSCTPGDNKSIEIGGNGGCGPRVVVDKDFVGDKALGKITIHSGGQLVYPDLGDPDDKVVKTIDIETTGIEIQSGGSFSVGTAVCPIGYHAGAHATITFLGDRKDCAPVTGCDDGSVKGIEVKSGGTLKMYGAKGVPNPADAAAGAGSVSWTVLRETAAAETTRLHLTQDVTVGQRPWEAGDWVTVATSSFSPFETEFVQIKGAPASDGMGGSFVDLEQKLVYSHFGGEAPTPSQECTVEGALKRVACGSVSGCSSACESVPSAVNYGDPAERNYGVDERAEVGLISRSIKLTAKLPAPPSPDEIPLPNVPGLHWGGEIRLAGGADGPAKFDLIGVEMEKFGKDQLGSYPLHVHMIGDAKNAPKIRANSIHHSFNKCMTVHMSSNILYEDNVCSRIVGHIFYEEFGSEENIAFHRNLGLGAMSNSFDIYKVELVPPKSGQLKRSELIDQYWWKGDNLARSAGYNYDGFNIPNTDDQKNPTHGSCQIPLDNGGFGASQAPFSPPHPDRCNANELYTEPASGFWLTNPTTELIGNAIGGCQGVGRGVWWVTPPNPIEVNGVLKDLKFSPLGIPGHPKAFFNNRAHACYGGFYGEEEYSVHSTVLVPHVGGVNNGQPIIARMEGMTATRNRFRGVWLRPTWFVVDHGRFATNRENVSLVTSGGIDGNAPGVWALLADSVIVGVSKNNVDRWGPCPTDNDLGILTGGQFGCIDKTPARLGQTVHSADEVGLGYPPPSWNMFGYMLYDGPVRVFRDRFVNFKYDVTSLLTEKDNAFLESYGSRNTPTAQVCVAGTFLNQHCNIAADCCPMGMTCPDNACPLPNVICDDQIKTNCCPSAQGCNKHFIYEGDAALGWFQSNQSSYPTGTVTRQLSFENTDLRHQIYTDKVSVNLEFNDGDKNTAVIDEDGTLTGYGVGDPDKNYENPGKIPPISLNNLPFNSTSNAVDECFSRGAQNGAFEGRDSSLISAGSMGTLEFSTLYPWKPENNEMPPTPVPFPGPDGDTTHTQLITFKRDDPERDGSGNVRKDGNDHPIHPSMELHSRDGRGIWEPKVTSGFGYTASAAVAPKSKYPSSTEKAGIAHIIDVGVADVVKPDITADNPFFVRLGICYSNEDGSHPQDPSKFTITRGYKSYTGGFVDPTDPELLKYWTPLECENLDSLKTANITVPNCPGPRQRVVAKTGADCPAGSTQQGTNCVFPQDVLERVDSAAEMLDSGKPNLRKYTYDKDTGMLFLWVAQDEPNPVAPSPLGSCTGNKQTDDPACPDVAHGETYYACPAKGCHIYLIKLDDPSYKPGASTCQPYEKYTAEPFKKPLELVLYGTKTPVKAVFHLDKSMEPFHTPDPTTDPKCMLTTAIAASTLRDGFLGSRSGPMSPVRSGAARPAGSAVTSTGSDESAAGESSPAASTGSGGATVQQLGTGAGTAGRHATSAGSAGIGVAATATPTPNGEPTPTSTPVRPKR